MRCGIPFRTAGKTKRDNLGENENVLLMKTLRDMNLSKLIAQDVPLFLSLLADLFPGVIAESSGNSHAEVFRVVDVVGVLGPRARQSPPRGCLRECLVGR